MAQQAMKELDMKDFKGLTLEELGKRLQGHGQDTLDIYLGWLQEQLNVWDLSESTILRPQVKLWCSNLRLHGISDQSICDAFALWKTNEIAKDACNARRVLMAEKELHNILSLGQTKEQNNPQVEQGRADIITVQDDQVVVVSSGAEDSDVEFLGWRSPNNSHHTTKRVVDKTDASCYRTTAVNKENQPMRGATDGGYDAPWDATGVSKKTGHKQHREKLPRRYVCDRCNKKGHRKEDCPTNLDPSYDVVPTRPYQCLCCRAYGKHLTTLCPQNKNPQSVTQQRIRAGIITSDLAIPMESDHYRRSYSVSRKSERGHEHEPSEDIDDIYIHEDRRALLERSNCHSPQLSNQKEHSRGSHYSPPSVTRDLITPAKRQLDHHVEQVEPSKRRRQHPRRNRGKSPSSGNKTGGSTELLPQVVHYNNETDGRLSYWDDGYDDVQMSEPSSSEKRPAANGWPTEGQEAVLRRLFPDADALWLSSMASFDADNFFDELDGFIENQAAGRGSEGLQTDLGQTLNCIEEKWKTALSVVGSPREQCADAAVTTEEVDRYNHPFALR